MSRKFRTTVDKLRACLGVKQADGSPRDSAEDDCRGQRSRFNPAPLPPRTESIAASSVGSGWRMSNGYMGSGAVVNPDPEPIADAFRMAGGTVTKTSWRVHAKEQGLSPEAADMGWQFIVNHPDSMKEAALRTLRTVFGEGNEGEWSGYWVNGVVSPQASFTPGSPVGKREKAQGGSPEDAPGFPFHTRAGEKIWSYAQELVLIHPEASIDELLRLSCEQSKVSSTELTPEDGQMLRLALDWLQNGHAKADLRTGGTPGGPFRSTGNLGAP